MKKVMIIGIGSPFGDDQIGWKVSQQIKDYPPLKYLLKQAVSVVDYDRPGVRLLEHMRGADIVYLIDGVVSDKPVGTIYRLVNHEIETFMPVLSSHMIGLAETLKLGRVLNELPAMIILYGIEIRSIASSEVSELFALNKSITDVVQSLANEVLAWYE